MATMTATKPDVYFSDFTLGKNSLSSSSSLLVFKCVRLNKLLIFYWNILYFQ